MYVYVCHGVFSLAVCMHGTLLIPVKGPHQPCMLHYSIPPHVRWPLHLIDYGCEYLCGMGVDVRPALLPAAAAKATGRAHWHESFVPLQLLLCYSK